MREEKREEKREDLVPKILVQTGRLHAEDISPEALGMRIQSGRFQSISG
jgi:hypothetical protein